MLAKNINLDSEWLDLNEELGVDKFQTILIQNKSCGGLYLWPRDILPDSVTSGIHLKIGQHIALNGGGESIHAKGIGEIYFQIVETISTGGGTGGSGTTQYALTNTQLRQSPININLPINAATAENQISQIVILDDIFESLKPVFYTSRLDEVSDTVFYVGKATVGSLESEPKWQIARYTQTGGILKSEYAGSLFDKVWSNRFTLTYV